SARVAMTEKCDGNARVCEHSPGPLRAFLDTSGGNPVEWRVWLRQRFLRARVLAVRPRPARSGETRKDGHRLPADAGPGLLQPGGGEEEDRRDDQGPSGPVTDCPERAPRPGALAFLALWHGLPTVPQRRFK